MEDFRPNVSSQSRKHALEMDTEDEAPPAKVSAQIVTMEEITAMKTSGASTSVIVSVPLQILLIS